MNFSSFLHSLDTQVTSKKAGRLHFTGPQYPLLFFSLVRNKLDSQKGVFRSVNVETLDLEQLKAEVSMTFLAENLIYWCGNINDLDAKKRKNFLSFAQHYDGPHALWFFADQDVKNMNDEEHVVTLSQEISLESWKELQTVFIRSKQKNATTLDILYKRMNILTLDSACLLLHYASVVSRPLLNHFMNEWLDIILVPEKSLFTLSTHFFAKRADLFFALWQEVQHDYPPQFWIAFWSEQLFRGTFFVKLAHEKKFLEAKKIAYRLPFTLIKKDWKALKSKELASAHNFLYDIDYRLKNGGDSFCLDLFYSRFFSKNSA